MSVPVRFRGPVGVLASVALGALAGAQEIPVFEAETALMEVEVRVTDGQGQTVRGLAKEDFSLSENGEPQTIATFEFVPGFDPDGPVGVPAASSAQVHSQDVAALRRGSFVYIATRGRREDRPRIARAVQEFLDEHLAPGMFVSIQGAPFTSRKSELHAELRRLFERGTGGATGDGLVDTLAVDRARDIEYSDAFESLVAEANEEFEDQVDQIEARQAFYRRLRMYEYIDLIQALSVYPGQKLVVLFATGLPVDEDNLDIMETLEDTATRARVRFYVADVGGLSAAAPGGTAEEAGSLEALLGDPFNDGFARGAENRQGNQDGLFELARRTGGRAVLNSNDFGEVFDVAMRESGDYYLLGYYPEDREQRGRLRRLRIRTQRKGLRISHQRGYYEERPFERMSRTDRNLRMREAILFDTPYTDLPLRVDHEFFRNSNGGPTVVYSVGIHAADLPAAAAKQGQSVELTVIARAFPLRDESDESDPPVEPVVDERRFRMAGAAGSFQRLGNAPNAWLHYGSQMPLKPGRYDWKVVVRDDHTGALGSYQTRLEIPETGPRFGASSLLLTSRIADVSGTAKKRTRKRAPEDVLEVAGSRFYASSVKAFQKGDAIYLLYDVYNPGPGSLDNPPGPTLALYRERERIERLPVQGHQTVPQPEANRVRYLAALATDELAAGNYTIAALLPSATPRRSAIYRKFTVVDSETR